IPTTKDNAGAEETMKVAMVVLASAALVCAPAPAHATDYPSKPITLMIGFAPGGPSDVMARILTKKMEEILKQPMVIENRAGPAPAASRAPRSRARRQMATRCCSRPAACLRST